jgi:hypothetical protein
VGDDSAGTPRNGRPTQLFSWEEGGRTLTSNSSESCSSALGGIMKRQQGRHQWLVLAAEGVDQGHACTTGVVFVAAGDVRDPPPTLRGP